MMKRIVEKEERKLELSPKEKILSTECLKSLKRENFVSVENERKT